jgi:hypothetical protein
MVSMIEIQPALAERVSIDEELLTIDVKRRGTLFSIWLFVFLKVIF